MFAFLIRILFVAAFFAAFSQLQTLAADTAEWTRFRGPNGSGLSDADTVPVKFEKGDYNWRVELPGTGHGSPVIWEDKLFVMSGFNDSADRALVCLSTADGSTLWTKRFLSKPYHLHKYNNYGTTTPAVDKDHVYTYWVTEDEVALMALDHSGKEVWKKNLGSFKSSHGGGTSPMLYEDMVVIANDQMGDSYLLAVDKATGETRWKVPRSSVNNGTAYAVPCVYQADGESPQLVFASRANGMTGIDPQNGKVLWELSDLFSLRVVASPVVVGDLVFATCGQGGGGKRFVAVRPGSPDGSRPARLVYEVKKSIPYVPTPVACDGRLFVINDGTGVASCLDAATGDVKWQERLGGSFFGSPVCVNGIIYVIDKEGAVVVFRAADKFELLHRHDLGELSYATPAVAQGRMYLRTQSHLVSIGS